MGDQHVHSAAVSHTVTLRNDDDRPSTSRQLHHRLAMLSTNSMDYTGTSAAAVVDSPAHHVAAYTAHSHYPVSSVSGTSRDADGFRRMSTRVVCRPAPAATCYR